MEVEDAVGDQNIDQDTLKMNSSPDIKFSEPAPPPVVNGISNGFSETPKEPSETPKEKSEVNGRSDGKDREREKDKERSRDKDKDRHKHSSSSSSKHREHSHSSSSSHKSKSKDKDRDRDKDKEKDRDKDREHKSSSSSSSKDKEKSSSGSSSKHHSSSSSSSKDKDKHKSSSSSSGDKSKHSSSSSSDKHRSDKHSSSSDKKHSSSSSSKDKDRDRDKEKSRDDKDKERSKDKDRDKEKSRDKDKERDRDKERSKDKEKSRDKDKERSKDKDKDRDKNRDRDKDKERSKDKHRDKSRDKERSKDEHKDKRKDEDKVKLYNGEKEKRKSDEGKHKSSEHEKPVKVKEEPKVRKVYVDDDDDDDEDFQPAVVKKEIKEEQEDFIDGNEEEEEATRNESEVEDARPIKQEYDSIKEEPSEMEDSGLQIDESKSQEDSEDDIPLSKRASLAPKRKVEEDLSDEDDVPLSMRKKVKKEPKKKKRKPASDESESEEDFKPAKKKAAKKAKVAVKKEVKQEASSPTKGRKKKEEEEQEVWKWWEEEKKPDGVKWNFLEHKGPVFAPPYEPLPKDIKFYYDGKSMELSQDAEEVATFYARMIEHEYTTMEAFNKNFFKDWTSVMTSKEKSIITDLKKCDFRKMHAYFVQKSEERKAMSKEEKKALKEKADEIQKEFGFCIIDGHKEKIGNFRIEPPGLFRGRGQHPKMGKLKLRVLPEDVMINCSKDSKIPQAPEGHKWKEVRHDNTVTWLASWTENVQGQVKYVMLNPSSRLKGEKDWQKYETARKLARSVDKIRAEYIAGWKSKEMRIRQRAVALYFIDKLALRAGNEKDEDQADTVGCCSLRVEHIRLHEESDDKKYVVEFDFPGKDSIRYHNFVPVEKKVFRNLQLFMENKKTGDDLFDRLNTAVLNKHLNELMEGLTAKVFRTYNASITLQNQLDELTDPDASVAEKILQYNRANRAVAVLCNHQRSVPKTHDKAMGNLDEKIEKKKEQVKEAEKQVKEAKKEAKGSAHGKMNLEKKQKCLQRLREQLVKLEVQRTDKDENKTIALGTSKLNYLDPRISVAWCKKYDVPIDKIYNKTQRDKFRWAIDMAGPDYVF